MSRSLVRWASSAGAQSHSTASGSAWSSWSSAPAEIGARHGVGIVDHIEDRIVGLKVRDLYEVPAAAILDRRPPRAREARMHDPPEQLQGSPREPLGLPLYGAVAGALRADLDAYMDSVNEVVTGEVTIKLYAARLRRPRSSPYALYDRSLASFGSPAGVLTARESGFIELFTLHSGWHRVRKVARGKR